MTKIYRFKHKKRGYTIWVRANSPNFGMIFNNPEMKIIAIQEDDDEKKTK